MTSPTETLRKRPARLRGWACLLLPLMPWMVLAAAPDTTAGQLERADRLRTADPVEFRAALQRLEADAASMTEPELHYFHYLQGWRSAYAGDYESAIPVLREVASKAGDVALRFRAGATATNVYILSRRYKDAFALMNESLALLPEVKDVAARQQGLSVIAFLYNQVDEYDLGLKYAEMLIAEGAGTRGECSGWQLKLEALYRSGRLQRVGPEFQSGLDICTQQGESTYANAIRTFVARIYIDQGKYDEALTTLRRHYDEVNLAASPRIISGFESLLALAYRETGDPALARQSALNAIEKGVRDQYTEPLITAYRILYLLAKEQGDSAAALTYYEKYAAADKGYIDDIGVRQLAYERAKHEAMANRLQIDTLNKENEVLQLQRENNRLYIALLISVAGFIAFFAYRTKRSQLHFMKLSQQDGLTGIANRPHFISVAEAALAASKRTDQEVCVVLCDLDHFKAINDQYGHAAGDIALRHVVDAFRAHLRSSDVFGRVGGEEFGILLPGCSLEAARERCEQLRRAVTDLVLQHEGREISLSASFGVETTISCGYELRPLLANADVALYQAKHAGRNRVVTYDASLSGFFASMTATGRFRASRDRFNQDFVQQPE